MYFVYNPNIFKEPLVCSDPEHLRLSFIKNSKIVFREFGKTFLKVTHIHIGLLHTAAKKFNR
jgi:hypothetical protein